MKLINGVVEGPSEGGGITVRKAEGGILRNVRLLNRDSGRLPKPGEECLVVADGAKFFWLGQIESINAQPINPGEVVLRDVDPTSGLGAGAVISADSGVVLDAGGVCLFELVNGKHTLYAEKSECCMPGMHTSADHDGTSATYHCTVRDTIDLDAADAELAYDDARATTRGSAVHLDIGGQDFINIDIRSNGVQQLLLRVRSDGTFDLSVPGKLGLQLGAELVVDSTQRVVINGGQDVVIDANNVFVGAESGAEPLAIGPAVQAALEAVAQVLSTHQHSYIVPLIPGATVITTPGAPSQTVPTLQDVSAIKAKGV